MFYFFLFHRQLSKKIPSSLDSRFHAGKVGAELMGKRERGRGPYLWQIPKKILSVNIIAVLFVKQQAVLAKISCKEKVL